MFSRPVSSGWIPARISMRAPILPRTRTLPDQGSVTREMIFSVVDLPLPFGPMIPTASDSRTVNDTSARAQMLARCEGPRPSEGAFSPARSMASENRPVALRLEARATRRRSPRRKRFHTCSSEIITRSRPGAPAVIGLWTSASPSDDIGEGGVEPLEHAVGDDDEDQAHAGGDPERPPLRPGVVQEDAPE